MKYIAILLILGYTQLSSAHRGFSCSSARSLGFTFVNDPSSCDSYTYCTFNNDGSVRKTYHRRCPGRMDFWDDYCWPRGYKCSAALTCPLLNLGTFYAGGDDCVSYSLCVGSGVGASSCVAGWSFCRGRAMCVVAETVSCHEPEPFEPDCDTLGDGYHPVDGSCTKYFFCYSGTAYEYECGTGLHFSQAAGGCIPEADSDCGQETETTTSGGEDETTVEGDTTVDGGDTTVDGVEDSTVVEETTVEEESTIVEESTIQDAPERKSSYQKVYQGEYIPRPKIMKGPKYFAKN